MYASIGDVVLPGERLADVKENATDNKKIVLGDGLRFVNTFNENFLI